MNMPAGHARGHLGEQTAGFILGERGYIFVAGPGGEKGHGITTRGFDGVAYNPQSKHLIIYDNKSFKHSGNISSASAITQNLKKNIDDLLRSVLAMPDLPHQADVIYALRRVRDSVRHNRPWPKTVQIAVTNAAGNSTGITEKLMRRGINFIDLNKTPAPNVAAIDVARRQSLRSLEQAAAYSEARAIRVLEQRLARSGSNRIANEGLRRFLQTSYPGIVAQQLIRISRTLAAQKAKSLVPVVGWAMSAYDFTNGIKDLVRGRVARGLSAVGCAIGDITLDALHAADAVSGVGGTVASLAAQSSTIACQVAIEVNRAEERMRELSEDIARRGRLPPETTLRNYYHLDDEAIRAIQVTLL